MVANKEFKMFNKSIELSHYVRNNVVGTIPSIHRDLRIHLLDEVYSLIKILLSASYNKGNIRSKYINELIVTISMIDYLLGEISNINNNKKVCIHSIKMLSEIKNMVYAWKSNIDAEKSNS